MGNFEDVLDHRKKTKPMTARIKRTLALFGVIASLTACSPEEWIAFRFTQRGADQTVVDQAIRVARCESGMNPGAVSASGTYLGLFQMGPYHHHRPGMDQPLTAQGNAAAAADLWAEQGWSPWTCRP